MKPGTPSVLLLVVVERVEERLLDIVNPNEIQSALCLLRLVHKRSWLSISFASHRAKGHDKLLIRHATTIHAKCSYYLKPRCQPHFYVSTYIHIWLYT